MSKLYSSINCAVFPFRYVHLREEVHLDSIPGMVFCPRSICGARVVSEPQSDLAVCNECNFPFCKICRQTWHGIESCPALSKVDQILILF